MKHWQRTRQSFHIERPIPLPLYIIAALVVVGLVSIIVLLAGCGYDTPDQPTEYDRYVQMCHDKGGVVSAVDVHWVTIDYTCYGNTFDKLLPNFSG